jgi:hypothetical protein
MSGTDVEAAGQAPNGIQAHAAQNHNPATPPYQRIEDYVSNVNRYKIIESMKGLRGI